MKTQQSALTLEEIASRIEVTTDTLRNWQRLGVLKFPVSEEEIDSIKEELVARGKLSSRANKLYKQKAKKGAKRHWSDYESSLDESFRGREGIYYTPQSIVEDMMMTIPRHDIDRKIFLDPCCGSGNFLVEALGMGFSPENIYGFDTDPEAVAIARGRVPGANIICGDFLEACSDLTMRLTISTPTPHGASGSTGFRGGYIRSTMLLPIRPTQQHFLWLRHGVFWLAEGVWDFWSKRRYSTLVPSRGCASGWSRISIFVLLRIMAAHSTP